MTLNEIEPPSFSKRIRESNPLLWYILACCTDGFLSWTRPKRRSYLRWRPWLYTFGIIVTIIFALWFILARKFEQLMTTPSPYEATVYRSTNIRVPQYLLMDTDGNGQSKCEQVVENMIPHSPQQNLTEKELINSLFGKLLNPSYTVYSNLNETTSMMVGKFCSNASNEWILFRILEKETYGKFSDINEHLTEVLSDGTDGIHQCVPFDFQKCSLKGSNNVYPKVFHLDHEQHITKKISGASGKTSIETTNVIYHYIRLTVRDYLRYKRQLTESNSMSLNVTILPYTVTPYAIQIKVKIMPNGVPMQDMKCATSLETENLHQISAFHMNDWIVDFDQLTPETNYNICVSCPEAATICKSMKTSEALSNHLLINTEIKVIIILGLIMVFLLIIAIPKVGARNNQSITPIDNQTIEEDQNSSTNVSVTNLDFDDDEGSRNEQMHDTISLGTVTGVSVQETRGSVSSVESLCYRPFDA